MTRHTVIAVFDRNDDARRAVDAVIARGIDRSSVHLGAAEDGDADALPAAAVIEGGPATGLMHRLSVLFGVAEPHLGHYEEAVRRGGTVVSVEASDETQAATARDALLAQGAVDIDDRVGEWQRGGWQTEARAAGPAAGRVVHRDDVSLGGVRVFGYTAVYSYEDHVDDFRADHATHHSALGSWDEVEPAYRFGVALATEAGADDGDWDEIEPDARARWERDHTQSTWERYKTAVRHAWERVTR